METKALIKQAKESAFDTGTVLGGMIGAHILTKTVKQDNYIGNGGLFLGGMAGAMYVKNPRLRLLLIATAAFGGLRLANLATNDVVKSTDGLAGMIPDSVKMKIREFLPNLQGPADLLLGENNPNDMPNLDDPGMNGNEEYANYEEVSSRHMNGLGDVSKLL